MSDHTWTLENLDAYAAGGLEPDERERLEQHAAACAACAQGLREAQAVDQALTALFVPVRPAPALEDRLIRGLWTKRSRPWRPLPWAVRIALGAAAVLLVGVLGAALYGGFQGEMLPFFGAQATAPQADATVRARESGSSK